MENKLREFYKKAGIKFVEEMVHREMDNEDFDEEGRQRDFDQFNDISVGLNDIILKIIEHFEIMKKKENENKQ